METPSPLQIAEAYLAHARHKSSSTEWAVAAVFDITCAKRWDELWNVLLCIARREEQIEVEALAFIAAGPLEDLVCKAGPTFIDRVEREATFNKQFGRLLTGTWLRRADPLVRERVVKFCRAFPDPIDGTYAF
jgi:hypothetical protein